MRLAPVGLEDFAFGLAEADPVTGSQRAGDVDGHAGKEIAEHALQCEANDRRQESC